MKCSGVAKETYIINFSLFKFEKFILHCSLVKMAKQNQIFIDVKSKILATVDASPKAEI